MSRDYLEEFLPDLAEFKEKTLQFHQGKISAADYKKFSGGFGSYAQRGGAKHMLRLRMAGGRLTKKRLHFLVESCSKYHIDRLKLTTCQSLQLHNLEPSCLFSLIEEAWRAGMVSRGGGGDFPRNVMASPLSGVLGGEAFDVMPYAEAAGDYLMHFIKSVKFPRKLKVSFSNSPENETHSTFRDLGFVAKPGPAFEVYAAGGLGIKPSLGVCVAKDAPASALLYYIKAMVNTFLTYGNYENRAKSRTRFMLETLGKEGFIKAYQEKLEETLATGKLDIQIALPEITKRGNGGAISGKRILPQKQEGLYAVFYQPIGGNLSPEKALLLDRLIETMDQVEIRLTPEEGMYIINCNAAEAEKILEATADGANNLFETSIACIGAQVCQVGIGDSQALLQECIQAVRREDFADGVLPKIHISGCPSSCGCHQVGAIGFRGGIKQTPAGPKPAFAIFHGGCAEGGREILADMGKAILAEDIPRFLTELGKQVASENLTYGQWISGHHGELEELIEKYTS